MLELVVRNVEAATTETGPAANVAEVDKVAAPTADRDKEEPPSPQYEPDQPPTPQDITPIYATAINEDGNDVAEDVDNIYGNISESVSEAAKTGCEFSDNTEGKQQDSDDNSVVFISERSLALTDNDQASPGSYDSEADSEYGTAASVANSLQSLSAALCTIDDTERWEATCRLFCHNQAHTAHDQGAKLLGTKRRLRPYQMEAAYELLQRSFGGQFHGGIMALGTGLGKTVASLAAIAIMRLVELNNSEVKQDWDIGVTANRRHNGPGMMGPCPSGNPWSIECCCVAGSLSSKIALQLGPGPSLILTPAGITSQFAGEATNYLEKQVQRPESDTCIPFVDTIDVSANSTLARDIRDDILTGFIGDQPIYMAPKKGDLQAVPAFVQGSGSQMGYTAGQVQQLFCKHRLLVVSSSPLSLLAKGEDYRSGFAQAYDLQQQQRRAAKRYIARWAVAPRFVILDEFHTVKDKATVVYKTLQQIRSQAAPGHSFKLAALSATPISVSLQRSLSSVLSLIIPPGGGVDAFCRAAQTIDSATKAGKPKDVDKYNDAITTCCKLLGSIMTLRTTRSLFHGNVLVPLPELHSKQIPCRSVRAQRDDFRRRLGELTAAWSQEIRASLRNQAPGSDDALQDRFFNFVRYNPSFMLTLWLASFPGIVDLPDELSSNPGEWLNSDKLGNTVATSEGRADHTVGRYIDIITGGSGKIEQLSQCLGRAREDLHRSCAGDDGQPAPVLKKHACVFTSRPGIALIVAAYADKHWASEWEVVMVLSAATPEGKKAIGGAFHDIPIGSVEKPTLFIATVGTCGTGLDSLQKANHAVLFDLPFVESERKQARGRIWRSGQRFPCYWTELWAADSDAEVLINDRHERRMEVFNRVLSCHSGDGSRAGGSEQ